MYVVYLDKLVLPVTPEKIQLKITNQNKTINLINEGDINILKKAGLTEISFTALLPNVKYPFAIYRSGFQNAQYYLEEIEKLKVSEKPFQFIVTRSLPNNQILYNSNIKVSLEEYSVLDDVKNGFDVEVQLKLKQYRDYGTKTCAVVAEKKDAVVATVNKERETTNSPQPTAQNKTYTVISGDSLWNIAKKFYGDGNQYNKIYQANTDKISNPNLIYPGQVLTIPV